MIESLQTVKEYAPLVTPFIPSIIDIFVKPKLQKLAKSLKRSGIETTISVEAKFTEYLERSYKKHFYIPILIFQNQQRSLKDIYVPLTVRTNKKDKIYVIDSFPQDFLPKYEKVLIRDTAGMGKSTLMKRLFLSCLETQRGIPVFIELRRLKGNDSILSFIHSELNSIDDELDQELILRCISDGDFIFFLDGYDEIAQAERERVTQNLHDFISKTGKNLFIMTSRPEASLASFPNFMEFDIQPLELQEAFSLLRKYDEGSGLAEEIIGKLEGKTLASVKDFLKNPLLVSLLYKSYEHKPTIPLKKHNFYRQVFDALFESHDLTKEGAYIRDKFCQLDSDSFHAVLRSLGFLTLKHGIEYDKDEILTFLKKAKERCSTINFKESKFLEDLLQTVPIFTIEGNKYRWSHKSLQDYFAAQFIWLDSNEDKKNILKRMVRSDDSRKYYNVLDLYYDMDYKSFRHIVIYDYLVEAIEHFESPTLVKSKNKLTEEEVKIIKLNTFGQSFFILPRKDAGLIDGHDNKEDLELNIKRVLEERGFNLSGYSLDLLIPDVFISYIGFENHNSLITLLLDDKMEKMLQKSVPTSSKKAKTDEGKPRKIKGVIGLTGSLIILEDNIKLSELFGRTIFPVPITQLSLDIEKCKKMKVEIELEMKKEQTTSLFADL